MAVWKIHQDISNAMLINMSMRKTVCQWIHKTSEQILYTIKTTTHSIWTCAQNVEASRTQPPSAQRVPR